MDVFNTAVVAVSLEEQNALLRHENKDLQRFNAELQRKLALLEARLHEKEGQERRVSSIAGRVKVKLDVGGVRMSTTLETLTAGRAAGSLLATWFTQHEGGGGEGYERDEDGCVFLDRDPVPFTLLLSWLRTGEFALVNDKSNNAVLVEALFFKVCGHMSIYILSSCSLVYPSSSLFFSFLFFALASDRWPCGFHSKRQDEDRVVGVPDLLFCSSSREIDGFV